MVDTKVRLVKDDEKEKEKDVKCRICSKNHPKYKCQFVCPHCSKKGHKADRCWIKYPKLNPNYVAPVDPKPPAPVREQTPALKKKDRKRRSRSQSDRGTDYESDGESPTVHQGRRRQRHKSNRVRTIEDDPTMGGNPASSGTPPSWGLPNLKLFRVREEQRVELMDEFEGVAQLFKEDHTVELGDEL